MEERAEQLARGEGLAFVLGAFRSGTTLLRKLLDSHSRVHAPAETWFLLPLLNLWDGLGATPHFNPQQAATALKSHLDQEGFMACCRAFAGRFYAARMPAGARWFVDKTPLYLTIASALPALFPMARFIVLCRDPRGTLWSRHTWKHLGSKRPEDQIKGVARDVQLLAGFLERHGERSRRVGYERLCAEPEAEARALCEFLGLEFEPAMIDYGRVAHHEGYGDEQTREHSRPHEASLARWGNGLSAEIEAKLAAACGAGALRTTGYGDWAERFEPAPAL